MPKLALFATLSAALALLLAVVFGDHAFVNYDSAYALLWGRDLLDGVTPDLEVPLAPTPHPLQTVWSMVLDVRATELLSYVSLGVAGALIVRLGQLWFGLAAGVVAAVLFLTREPVLSFGLRAYVDLPYLCLVLGALLAFVTLAAERRDRRADWAVLGLLALAGLLRPEAWLFSLAYVVWRRDPRLLVIAACAPVLWAVHDLLITGDPLHSWLGTADNADELGRKTGPVDLVLYGPRRLGEVLREPVLLGLVAGAWLAWRRRLLTPLAALALALIAFGLLTSAGLPILTRYLTLAAALACVLAGGAVVEGFRRGDRRWLAASVALLALLVAFGPAQADRLERLNRSIAIQHDILADLDALPDGALNCTPVATTTRRPVPQLALRFDGLDPRAVRIGEPGSACTYLAPASAEVAQRFIFDKADPVRTLPQVPPGFREIAHNPSWIVLARR
ncbi:MAG TPA: hypothetical protein VN238_00890 [Solirubrobacteraceae bacterium]|nr:hypothetical protein [Solirubrobacteraceae bacterium]